TAKTFHLDDVQEWKRIKEVAINTKENISSMLKDVRERRPTEIEAILGYIRKQHSSPEHIPFISFAYNGIKALEVKNTSNDVQSIEVHDTNVYDYRLKKQIEENRVNECQYAFMHNTYGCETYD